MNTRKLFFSCSLMAIALSLPLGCGDDETAATSGAGGDDRIPCERTTDCDDGNSCTFDNCILPEGYCTFRPVSGADPEAEQTDGDCKEIVCNGTESVEVDDDDDPPNDPDGEDCIEPICVEGAAQEGNLDAGDRCDIGENRGVCDGVGVCSCQAPTVNDRHFVDPVNGTDDPAFGGAPGGCAYRTLTYALTQAEGVVELAFGTYDSTNETFPIVLQGNRKIDCDRDDMNNRGSITGSGDHMGTSAVIVIAGASNDIDDCELDGGGAADVVVLVTTLGQGGDQHEIDDCDLHGATDGVVVQAMADETDVRNSTLRGFTGRAIAVDRLDANVDINDNQFQNNAVDIVCADASQNVDGDGNMGVSTCQVCQECPNF